MTPNDQATSVDPCVVHVDPRLKDLVPVFLANRRKDVLALQEGLSRGDFEAIRMIGHSLKGTGGGYGFNRITEIGREIEQAALSRDAEVVGRSVADLSDHLDRVKVVADETPSGKGTEHPLILSVDDDPDTLKLLARLLGYEGYQVVTAESANGALALLKSVRPHLILLDIMMPGMNGYELCANLQKDEAMSYIPVIFVTALGDERNKARAFAAGGVDYLVKPVRRDLLRRQVALHLETHRRWRALREGFGTSEDPPVRPDFVRFKKLLLSRLKLNAERQQALFGIKPRDLYPAFARVGMDANAMARAIAEFLKVPYRPRINPEHIQLGLLPTPFCRFNGVVAMNAPSEGKAFVLANPFDRPLMDALKRFRPHRIVISEPAVVAALLHCKEARTP